MNIRLQRVLLKVFLHIGRNIFSQRDLIAADGGSMPVIISVEPMLLEKSKIVINAIIVLIVHDLRPPSTVKLCGLLGEPLFKSAHIPRRKTKH